MGKINSIQSLGTVDGPGIRFVVFFQGCNLRCGCCHNPDTWPLNEGAEISAEEIATRAERYKSYFGEIGGITLSGGEPLLQPEFATQIFDLCKERGINTCLDTSGSLYSEKINSLLNVTDRVLLDVKYPTEELYRRHVGCSLEPVLDFLRHLNEKKIPTTLRQVTIPTLNDTKESMLFLKELKKNHPCVDKIELLPFRKICSVKYQSLKIPFPFENYDTPTKETMDHLNKYLATE